MKPTPIDVHAENTKYTISAEEMENIVDSYDRAVRDGISRAILAGLIGWLIGFWVGYLS